MTYNSVLKNLSEVNYAINNLHSLGLFAHPDKVKSWDTYKMVKIISEGDRSSFILDVGCNGSPILSILKRLGFKNLYGCDLFLKKIPSTLTEIVYPLYRPIIEIYEDKAFNISIQNLEKTNFQDKMFDYITSLSVIEHGVNIQNYFKEMNRIMKKGGILLTSTDYWPDKILNIIKTKHNHRNDPDNVFSKEEIEKDVLKAAELNDLILTEPIDFSFENKVVHYNVTGLDYTFIFFALKKT
ncbi:MAG: methyltransferase domain-containing protein [Nitrososphaeraceae archaeon]|nr:methyltransferase domain-containing protein [Nitrososphaeraceae archaeon]MDW0167938.1 methyltransferase domain-containing protein [Nitrososphaeraceae archaeon]MDW0170854.1 methyltransferase domain-containing protein [Nitrososphaeraceae archaeon]MDW0172443.1 methyltransferase domain-containing protein [Nitrososphaeraceae archaeon]MDW0174685.1 methyltransferase domain-containing protein [Nitrososphaeraceae archaeon]